MQFISCTQTNIGNVRKNNEDNYYVNGKFKGDPQKSNDVCVNKSKRSVNLYAVCDGMGGQDLGEIASLTAVKALKSLQDNFRENYEAYVQKSNSLVCKLIMKNGGVRSGTTFAALSIKDDTAQAVNVGDSRIYFYRNGALKQLSEDHTNVRQLVKMNLITEEAAKTHKDRHILTQHLGIFEDELIVSPYVSEVIPLRHGDMFLLCSDGLTDMLSDKEIQYCLKKDESVTAITKSLVQAALKNGGKDNITVQVIKCKKPSFWGHVFKFPRR